MPLNCDQARYNSEIVSSALSRQLFRRGAIRDLGVGVLASRTFGADLRSIAQMILYTRSAPKVLNSANGALTLP